MKIKHLVQVQKIPERPTLKYKCSMIYDKASRSKIPNSTETRNILTPMARLAESRHEKIIGKHLSIIIRRILSSEFPTIPVLCLSKFHNLLTEHEKKEIHQYPTVYFIGDRASKRSIFTDREGHYIGARADHIAYRYEIIKEMGAGAFSKVFKCYDHRFSVMVAIKIHKNDEETEKLAGSEIETLKLLNQFANEHIVKMLGYFRFRGHSCIVFEALSVNLYQYIQVKGQMNTKMIKRVASQVLSALEVLHSAGIAHADVKPENIVFVNKSCKQVKLIDFGSSVQMGNCSQDYIQSRHYRAPEIVLGSSFDQRIDLWSLGCVLYEMCTGRILFPAKNEIDLLNMIINVLGNPPTNSNLDCPANNRSLWQKKKCFEYLPSEIKEIVAGFVKWRDRMTIQDALSLLQNDGL